jgi:hypothetical protein
MKRIIWVIICIVLAGFVTAESTQQYSQIYLNPYYRSAMTSGVNYTYNVTINPPDGLKQIISAIVRYDIYLTPTVTFYLWVNGQICNTPSYLVHTTYMDSGIGTASFDCSNIINKEGDYTIKFQPSGANTGASNARLDLTYVNDPTGSISVSGTEYSVGDFAKVFLQVLDDSENRVSNAVCTMEVFYPNNTIFINEAIMTKEPARDLYYYDVGVLPNVTGVYMVYAECIAGFKEVAYDGFSSGDLGSGYGWTNIWIPSAGTCEVTTAGTPFGTYHFKSQSGCDISRELDTGSACSLINVSFWAKAASLEAGEYCRFYYGNGSAYFGLLNITDGGDDDTYRKYSYSVCPYGGASNASFRMYAQGTGVGDYCYFDDVLIYSITNQSVLFTVAGSSEMHVLYHLNWIKSILSSIWDWLTVTLWQKILGMEQTLNATYNNTELILDSLTGTGTIAEVMNQSSVSFLSSSYYSGESGRLYVQVLKGDLPMNNVSCVLTSYYPNGSVYVAGLMTAKGENGLYYYNITPLVGGSYAVSIKCENGSFTRAIYAPGSFEVIDVDQMIIIG